MVEALSLQVEPAKTILSANSLGVHAGSRPLLRDIDLSIHQGEVFGIIGPSGAGKSTLLKVFNRLVDLESPPLRVTGEVALDGMDLYAPDIDPDEVRRRVGTLFQQPVIFPKSIRANALFGIRHLKRLSRAEQEQRLEEALLSAALWNEVKDRLDEPATILSVGQQQRLCLARALAITPQVLLMDEPTSSLDPGSTEEIEALILTLRESLTVVLVTHDLDQARRVAGVVACVCLRDGVGEVIETACCGDIFSRPKCAETERYLSRRLEP
jgi:phosphate transport system ATP-binding protein